MRPNLEEARNLRAAGNVIPVFKSVVADFLTPVSAYLRLRVDSRHAFLLESVEGGEKLARYSFLGRDPFLVLSTGPSAPSADSGVEQRHYGTDRREEFFNDLRSTMDRFKSVSVEGLPPFSGGAVGYFGYDMVRLIEDVPDSSIDDVGMDDAVMMFFRTVLAFDHLRNQIHIVTNLFLEEDDGESIEALYRRAEADILATERMLIQPFEMPVPARTEATVEVRSNLEKADYLAGVERAKDYITAGDIFQVVLSQRFELDLPAAPFQIYRALRMVNPSPYTYFMEMPGSAIVGASPEMLVQVRGRSAAYRPIAGTRPRGKDEAEDRVLADDLIADEKERAEHVMLVDLGRNDLGRVSKYGSVRADEFMFIERYSHVMHLVSALVGELRDDVDRFDALMACFPAGTVSGAPKVRAMEIIDEQEPTKRGVYSGSVLYADFSGNLDSCIAIRTLVARDGKGYIQAGGGIVADSVPENEYQETVNKAKALVRALELAANGLEV